MILKISSLNDLKFFIKEFNKNHPRPHGEIDMTPLLDISIMKHAQWPSNELPGVYIFLDSEKNITYIGKASTNIGSRLAARFDVKWNPKKEESKGCHYITTIPLPSDAYFEAPAIEEYLLKNIKTRSNKVHNG
jgi:hypothetical protein